MRPRRYKKSEASRQQVLDAAIRVLAEHGYAKTSVSDIAAAAGMSKGAVHYHFESKDDLIASVLARSAEVISQRVKGAWKAAGAPHEKIRRAIREMRESRKAQVPEIVVLADLMAQAMYDPKLREAFARMFQENRAEVARQLDADFKELGLSPKIPIEVVPKLLLGLLDGLALQDFFDPPSESEEQATDAAIERIAFLLLES